MMLNNLRIPYSKRQIQDARIQNVYLSDLMEDYNDIYEFLQSVSFVDNKGSITRPKK